MYTKIIVFFLFMTTSLFSQKILPVGGSNLSQNYQVFPNGDIYIFTLFIDATGWNSTSVHVIDSKDQNIYRCGSEAYFQNLFRFNDSLSLITSGLFGRSFIFYDNDCEGNFTGSIDYNTVKDPHLFVLNEEIFCLSKDSSTIYKFDLAGNVIEQNRIVPTNLLDDFNLNRKWITTVSGNIIRLGDFETGKFIEIDSSGNFLNSYDIPFDGKTIQKEKDIYTINKKSCGAYKVNGFDERGNNFLSIELLDTCQNCTYEDVIYLPGEGIYTFGSIFHHGLIGSTVTTIEAYPNSDFVATKFDLNGNLIESLMYSDSLFSEIIRAVPAKDGSFVLLGHLGAVTDDRFPSPHNRIGYPAVVMITDPNFDGFEPLRYIKHPLLSSIIEKEDSKIRIGPIPARNKIKIQSDDSCKFMLNLFNQDGRIVREYEFMQELIIDVSNIPNGLYFYKVVSIDDPDAYQIGKILIDK